MFMPLIIMIYNNTRFKFKVRMRGEIIIEKTWKRKKISHRRNNTKKKKKEKNHEKEEENKGENKEEKKRIKKKNKF